MREGMKIVQVSARYYPYIGGGEAVVQQTSERLVKRDFDVEVLTTDPSGRLRKEDIVNDVKIKRFKSWAPNEAYYLPYPNMLSYLSRAQADIIHAHDIHALTTFVTYIAHNLQTEPKFVVSPFYHGRGHTRLAQILWIPYRPLAKKILKNADGIVVNSRAQRALLERTFSPSSKMFMVHDGVNLNEIKNAQSFTLDQNCRILLYVGRLAKYKNVHKAIASMKYLPDNYHFYIIGGGSFNPFLEKLVKSLGLGSRVHFLGFQPDDVVYRWLKTAHVFIHLSTVESFGMTCIESLAAGTPVIANDDGFGLRETIALFPEHIRIYRVSKEPVSKLARLMMEVAELKPITADVSQFSWDLIAESVSTVYKQILMER
jgi:glycosyltransferase involved in cell wall biosynthesis